MHLAPLIADIGDVIGMLITIAIIGFTVISQIIGAMSNGQGKKPARPGGRPAGQRPPRPPRQNVPPGAPRQIEAEIDDFLRQARGQHRPAKPPANRPAQEARPIIAAVPADEDVVPGHLFAEELVTHVEEHIGRDTISPSTAHLADIVEQSDEKLEQHLETVFDHDVGHLAHADPFNTSVAEGTDAQSWEEKAPPENAAAAIAGMLKSPQSIRKVFVVSEILKRPEI